MNSPGDSVVESKSLLQLIDSRRSIRQFTSDPVPDDLLRKIVYSAIWAPTGSNQQEVRFYPTTDPANIASLRVAKPNIKNPQAAILVYADVSGKYYHNLSRRPHKIALPFMDVGAACQNMLLTAHSLGLGACWLNVSPHWPGALALFKRFPLKATMRLVAAIFIGYPARAHNPLEEKHCGRKIQRDKLEEYLIDMPPISRVVCIHSIPRDAANLGSQALSSGLRKALHETLGKTPLGVMGVKDTHLQPYMRRLGNVIDMEPHEAIGVFKEEVKKAREVLVQLRAIPGVPFAWIRAPYDKFRGRVACLFGKKASYYPTSIVHDPFFPTPTDKTLISEYPSGCVTENREIRIPEDSSLLASERRWASRMNHRLPWLFAPAIPLQAASALRLLDWAQVVILDGNGNVADIYSGLLLSGLLNLALAKSSGAAVYTVNQTIAVDNPALSALVKYVYNSIDGVILREPKSKRRLLEMGVNEEKIVVGADCAVLVDDFNEARADQLAAKFNVKKGSIGLILRGDMSPDLEFWVDAVRNLRARFGREVIFISSSEHQDLDFGLLLGKKTEISVIQGLDDYAVFVPFIRRLGALITQRYHPIYFSIMAQVPFVPLLGNTFKAQGLLELFDYPCQVLDKPAWEELATALNAVLSAGDTLISNLGRVHKRLQKLAWLNIRPVKTVSEFRPGAE